ncbi:protein wings apart-like [Glossina fuscipes]|uniref:Protein wings apart-like n=1 Tax=Glossina fuscipes TaxID=7396 RepID=A0A9C5YZA2_9MUSC|nr:protein wings apart-like [Glossina fuscipes]KAI9582297.1 hypothetical protein GQX74_015420 [Glossina fuscipes]
MSRWGKNIVVPLDSTKENTNRPTVSRSLGTVGKWGKMGFTSTRTYTMSALPAAVAAAAAAVAAASPQESPASHKEDDLSTSVPEPPKPRKFFKSRNTTPPEVIAQIIQHLPRQSASPARETTSSYTTAPSILSTPVKDPTKVKTSKSISSERKKKSPKKFKFKSVELSDEANEHKEAKAPGETKLPKKKKTEKELKPEAPPSRILSRARKTVNYCEDDEEDRLPTPIKDIILPKQKKPDKVVNVQETPPPTPAHKLDDVYAACDTPEPVLPPPAAPQTPTVVNNIASKTPEHPPIVLRISKGTSRLVSTDSEEPVASTTPPLQHSDALLLETPSENATRSRQAPGDEVISNTITPKIIVKPPRPPSPLTSSREEEPPEINYCTVKISPDKPPKERLKLIIKTDVIRNALAAAAAAEAAKSVGVTEKAIQADTASSGNEGCPATDRPEKEKSKKNKKHKHLKHLVVEQLPSTQKRNLAEFKTPSPHLALGSSSIHDNHPNPTAASARTVISPPALSERDFDSQSSVLGSISSKGNSTPQGLAPQPEESCVLHSRGSSVITSDLETSQHSSLVAPPSDIELRLESMMMDGEASQQQRTTNNYVEAEPLQEDILAVLRGDESAMDIEQEKIKENGQDSKLSNQIQEDNMMHSTVVGRRITRGKAKSNYAEQETDDSQAVKVRNKKSTPITQSGDEISIQKRLTRRGKKLDESNSVLITMETSEELPTNSDEINSDKSYQERDPIPALVVRRGRSSRNTNNNNLTNNTNNINKIAASLSAKAGAAELQKVSNPDSITTPSIQRSYGRKRKNQQVTQVLQPSAEELEDIHSLTPAKLANLDLPTTESTDLITNPLHTINENYLSASVELHETNSMDSSSLQRPSSGSETPISPFRHDYKIKDKFKRTLTLDNQVNNAVVAKQTAPNNTLPSGTQNQTGAEPAVKLVISKKKGSIFKSRVPSEQTEQTNSKRHLYKHRWDATANGDTGSDSNTTPAQIPDNKSGSATVDAIFNDFTSDDTRSSPLLASKLTRIIKQNPQVIPHGSDMNEAVTATDSARGDRKTKDLYTVVHNVKTAHQIQEIGEYQEMDDDVEYILDALQSQNPMPTRCLSALQLATKCMVPAFRMHVRAHGVVSKFFKALSDANHDLSLGLCTSAIMYILSQEGLNMDLDRDSLELMMNLLESEQSAAAPADHANYERNKQKVRELCEEIKAQGKATHLNVESITVGTLAMETLLSLTSKRAGEWFKEELRELGGLEHIIKTINDCCRPAVDNDHSSAGISWTRPLLDNMQTVERCLRVLENVTQMNEENQRYILTYAQGHAINTLCSLYSLCDRELTLYPTSETTSRDNPGIVMRELLIPLMKVLINLTHPFNASNAMGADLIGQRNEVIDTSFHLLLQAPNYIPDRCVFELSILALLLLINLTMYTLPNRERIMQSNAPTEFSLNHDNSPKSETAISAIMSYFYKCEELARLVEKNTDALLDNQDKNKKKQEEVDETVNNLLQKAGHHMEHSLKGSYTAILIGHLIADNERFEDTVRKHLHGNGFKEIISVLEKYYNFMDLAASSEASVVAHIKSTKKLLDYFKKRDLIHEMNINNKSPVSLEKHENDNDLNTNSSSTPATVQRVYKTYSQR